MKASNIRIISSLKNPKKRILFLGYDENQTSIISALVSNNCSVDHTADKIFETGKYDLVISSGYRHILKKETIENFSCPIINLHISYLPYNRGAHPNFWSFYENTPSGVTIHLIDEGIDTGDIIFQKYVNFSDLDNSFRKTYLILKKELEILFIKNIDKIINDTWKSVKQKGVGTHHFLKDLPVNFSGWDSIIKVEIERLKKEGLHYE